MLSFIHRKNKKNRKSPVGPVWSPWVGTGDFLRNGGGADAEWPPPDLPPGMLCPLSSPLPALMVGKL